VAMAPGSGRGRPKIAQDCQKGKEKTKVKKPKKKGTITPYVSVKGRRKDRAEAEEEPIGIKEKIAIDVRSDKKKER